ncbi:MAG: type III pantothenate kinase [Spirochaetia bacterium]|nr:type III pantothenate kinase [Spirochaetia bacterium]
MILTIDIGNTDTIFAFWEKNSIINSFRVNTKSKNIINDCENNLVKYKNKSLICDRAIYCSVVPSLNNKIEKILKEFGIKNIFILNLKLEMPYEFNYQNKETLGADRLANAAGAVLNYGKNVIIVDFGTAITFCLIVDSVYQGGLITPGIKIALDSLVEKTAALKKIEIENQKNILGKSTELAMKSGLYYGWKGLVKEIIQEIKNYVKIHHKNQEDKLILIATGGISENLYFIQEIFDIIDKNLTLRGLLFLYHKNYNNS